MFEPMLSTAPSHAGPSTSSPRLIVSLGTQMKATGEVMSLGTHHRESLLKAVRSLEIGVDHF